MASDTIVQDVCNFLKQYPPFDIIPKEELRKLASVVTMQYYEEGAQVFSQGDEPYHYFFVVNKGSIQITEKQEDGQEHLIDQCDEGDIFGVRASIANDTYIASALAPEESLLYTIPMDQFNEIMERNPKVALFLASGFASGVSILKSESNENVRDVKRFLDNLKEDDDGTQLLGTDTLNIHTTQEIVSCSPQHTVREAAKIMSIFNVGSILVLDEAKKPLGILTDSDFRRKVVAQDELIKNRPVTEVMSSPVKTIRPDLAVAEVMVLMVSHKVSHFCVTEDGTDQTPALAIVSQRDVLIAQGNNPAVLAKQMMNTKDVQQLAHFRGKAEYLVRSYLHQEVGVPFISHIITEINDVLFQKAGEIATETLQEEGLKPPSVKFCWMSLGSEGRKEQFLRTDQDNALVYEDPPLTEKEYVKEYFQKYTHIIMEILVKCGFVKCPAGMMASNPEWCQPRSVWESYFRKWIETPDPKSVMNTNIFFDFRPIIGEASLADGLKEYIFKLIDRNEIFLAHLAKSALQNPPPLSFFRSFIVEKGGSHKDEFDIKARAMMPLTDAARVLAYDLRIRSYGSTFGRFEEVAKRDEKLAPICEAAAMAYEILLRQRAIHGLKNNNSGRFINPDDFNKLERQTIRNTFKTIEKIQQTLELRYRLGFMR